MLTHLSIQGLAVIESLSVDFADGFNVITGETGAGKSILIKALSLLLGGKTGAETVRKGFPQAIISAQFHVSKDHHIAKVLTERGIPFEISDGEISVLLRRQISAKGRSLAWVNDVSTTLSSIQEIGAVLIDIYAQHENHRLLDQSQHIHYLDQFLKDKTLPATVENAYRTCQEQFRDIKNFVEAVRSRQRDLDYLQFRCSELDKFDASEEDYQSIYQLCQHSSEYHGLKESLTTAQSILEQGVDGEALSKPLWEVARLLNGIKNHEAFNRLGAMAGEIANQVDELSYQLVKNQSADDVDEEKLEEAQSRLAEYQDLFRKLSVADITELVAEATRLRGELDIVHNATHDLKLKLVKLVNDAKELKTHAELLSKDRRKAIKSVKQKIEQELRELEMPGATLDIELTPIEKSYPAIELVGFGEECVGLFSEFMEIFVGVGESGSEKACFLLAANAGEPAFALQKIASGGEVSRIMLGLKRALAVGADSCLLVFDEIDSGISGKVADVVGRKLKDLAKSFQVLCISHLAQVAAYADSHFQVKKQPKGERTESQIIQLNKKQSEEEIARLLSGPEVTKQSLANARALVERARSK
jgi:DNA repair protein RecN (Recombination protein N)